VTWEEDQNFLDSRSMPSPPYRSTLNLAKMHKPTNHRGHIADQPCPCVDPPRLAFLHYKCSDPKPRKAIPSPMLPSVLSGICIPTGESLSKDNVPLQVQSHPKQNYQERHVFRLLGGLLMVALGHRYAWYLRQRAIPSNLP